MNSEKGAKGKDIRGGMTKRKWRWSYFGIMFISINTFESLLLYLLNRDEEKYESLSI
jgi:hypothetical protein